MEPNTLTANPATPRLVNDVAPPSANPQPPQAPPTPPLQPPQPSASIPTDNAPQMGERIAVHTPAPTPQSVPASHNPVVATPPITDALGPQAQAPQESHIWAHSANHEALRHIGQDKIHWLAILLALVVAVVLLAAAYFAFQQSA